MFLVVFATIAIALIGTYTQVLAVEIARIANAQTSLAHAMMSWHTAAVSMAASVIDTNSTYTTANYPNGCSLTNDKLGLTAFPHCPGPYNASVSTTVPIQTNGTITNALSAPPYTTNLLYNKASSKTECVHLPNSTCSQFDGNGNCTAACTTTFDAKTYEFYSVMFRSGGADYVVTFASMPTIQNTLGANYLTLGGGKQISLTPSDLLKQLRNVGLSTFSYGTVSNSVLTAGTAQYTLPTAANIPSGAVALIGFPDGF